MSDDIICVSSSPSELTSRSSSPVSMWSIEDLDIGIYDMSSAPSELVDQLYEAKMRFAIYNTIPDGLHLSICILPSTIITILPRHQVFINHIMDDPRARWMLRGVCSGVETYVSRRTEMTRFTFHTKGEKNTTRKAYLFVRVSPPHFVELGTVPDTGEISVRIQQSTDVFGDIAELSIATAEDDVKEEAMQP
jgi:hypothetical protein